MPRIYMGRSTKVAYASGYLDGEGSIYMNKCPSRIGFSLMVKIVTGDKASLELFAELWGGEVITQAPRQNSRRALWRWSVSGARALVVLKEVRPHLRTKRKLADLGLRCKVSLAGRFLAHSKRGRKASREIKRRAWIRDQMVAINRRRTV